MPVARGGAFLIESDKRGDFLRHEPRDRSPIRFPTSSLALCLCPSFPISEIGNGNYPRLEKFVEVFNPHSKSGTVYSVFRNAYT